MNTIHQFDIWFARLPMREDSHVQGGRRPVIVVSNEVANKYSPIVSVIPLTSKVRKRRLPTHVSLCAAGLPVRSLALCEQLTVIDKRQLTTRVGTVNDPFDRAAINRAMAVQLGMAAA